jgi:hypothetical protein
MEKRVGTFAVRFDSQLTLYEFKLETLSSLIKMNQVFLNEFAKTFQSIDLFKLTFSIEMKRIELLILHNCD